MVKDAARSNMSSPARPSPWHEAQMDTLGVVRRQLDPDSARAAAVRRAWRRAVVPLPVSSATNSLPDLCLSEPGK
jgi:hypothetical protein